MRARFLGIGAPGAIGGSPPQSFSVTSAIPSIGENLITWQTAIGATSYTLKRGTVSGTYPTTVDTNATSGYIDTGLTTGTTYYYRVYAVNAYGTTISSNEVSGQPQIFSSLKLNGTSQYLIAATNAALKPNYNTAFWLNLWVKTTQVGQPTIISNLDITTTGLYILLDSGKVRAGLWSTSAFRADVRTTSVTVNDGNWHHIIIVNTAASGTGAASDWKIYVDGVSAALTTLVDSLASHSTLSTESTTIGADLLLPGAEDFFNAYLNQFAWKQGATLTAGNVTAIYNAGIPTDISSFTPGVWLYLYGGSDSIAVGGLIDRGTAGMNFTPINTPTVVNNIRIALGNSFYFDGTTTRMNGGAVAALNYTKTQKMIFTSWMYVVTGDLGKSSIFCHEDVNGTAYKGWDAFISSGGTASMYMASNFAANNYLQTGTSATLPLDKWVLVVWYCDGTATTAGTKFWMIPAGTFVTERAKGDVRDTLAGAIDNPALLYYMGDANLDVGNDFLKGRLYNSGIILGQTCDDAFIQAYISNQGYPRDLTRAPGIAHVWGFGFNGDTISSVPDHVGSVTLSTEGTGALVSKNPFWFD